MRRLRPKPEVTFGGATTAARVNADSSMKIFFVVDAFTLPPPFEDEVESFRSLGLAGRPLFLATFFGAVAESFLLLSSLLLLLPLPYIPVSFAAPRWFRFLGSSNGLAGDAEEDEEEAETASPLLVVIIVFVDKESTVFTVVVVFADTEPVLSSLLSRAPVTSEFLGPPSQSKVTTSAADRCPPPLRDAEDEDVVAVMSEGALPFRLTSKTGRNELEILIECFLRMFVSITLVGARICKMNSVLQRIILL